MARFVNSQLANPLRAAAHRAAKSLPVGFNSPNTREMSTDPNYGSVLISLVPGGRFCLYRRSSRSESDDALPAPCEAPGANACAGPHRPPR